MEQGSENSNLVGDKLKDVTEKDNNFLLNSSCQSQTTKMRKSFRLYSHSRPQKLRSFWPAAGVESSGSNHFRHAP